MRRGRLRRREHLDLHRAGRPHSSTAGLETLPEGLCVQSLHIGSYDNETELLRQMHHEFIPSQPSPHAKHHEIYLSDARKVEPAKLKTILRQPVATQ